MEEVNRENSLKLAHFIHIREISCFICNIVPLFVFDLENWFSYLNCLEYTLKLLLSKFFRLLLLLKGVHYDDDSNISNIRIVEILPGLKEVGFMKTQPIIAQLQNMLLLMR